jgi:hypothetical protein
LEEEEEEGIMVDDLTRGLVVFGELWCGKQ